MNDAEKARTEKISAKKVAVEKVAAEKVAADMITAENITAEKITAKKITAEKVAAENATADKVAAEKVAAKKVGSENVAAEKVAAGAIKAAVDCEAVATTSSVAGKPVCWNCNLEMTVSHQCDSAALATAPGSTGPLAPVKLKKPVKMLDNSPRRVKCHICAGLGYEPSIVLIGSTTTCSSCGVIATPDCHS